MCKQGRMFRQGCHHQAPGTTTGTTNSEGLGFEVGLSTAFAVAPPTGRALDWGNTCPPQGGTNKKDGAVEKCTPHKTPFPGGNANTFQPSYKPYKPSYKPSYKPCTAPREFVQTVQTVHQGSLLSNTPNRNGLYGLYEFPKRRAWFV